MAMYSFFRDPVLLLGWFFHGAVGVEGLQLLLDSTQRVGQLAVVQDNDGLLDPGQQVRGKGVVLIDHLLCFNSVI